MEEPRPLRLTLWGARSAPKARSGSQRRPSLLLVATGRRRLLPLLLAVLAAVATADELEKPAGEAQQVELATTPAPTPVPVCKGGCPPNCNYPRLCKIHQTTYKCRCASCEQCEGVKPVENTGTGKEIFKRRVVGPPK